MNVTELARRVRITPNKLREIMPQLGFDIGVRAIKVDPKMAQAIMEKLSDKQIREKYLGESVVEREKRVVMADDRKEDKAVRKKIDIPEKIVVKELARRMEVSVANLMMELVKNGVMASLNQFVDFETASIIAEDMGFEPVKSSDDEAGLAKNIDYSQVLGLNLETATPRPPVVVVMGHVDHGKTKLLDAIRKTNIVEGEAGGITQHIGAYQVILAEKGKASLRKEGDKASSVAQDSSVLGRTLTFIDTPGHEAFSAMRSRGAQVADIAILLVAADDGVQPQTIEAVAHIKNAGLPFIVAINKIDKANANVNKVKSDLANIGLTPEDWGGNTICVEVSAKEGLHILELLETLFLVADIDKEKIVANQEVPAIGTIIEAHIDKGEGPVATVLVQTGTLKKNDFVDIGGHPGKIRLMKNWEGKIINEVRPSMPAKILGLKSVPQVGDILRVIKDKKEIKHLQRVKVNQKNKIVNAPDTVKTNGEEEGRDKPQVKIILKSDVFGTIEAILESLDRIKSKIVEVKVIKQGLGNITEKDVEQAKNLEAFLIGFNVKTTGEAKRIAVAKGVEIYNFQVIYDLLQLVEEEVRKAAGTQIVRSKLGIVKILKVFRSNKLGPIVGARVIAGKVTKGTVGVVKREGKEIGEIKVFGLQAGHEEVREVVEGQEFGMQMEAKLEVMERDEVVIYSEEEREAN